MCCCFSNCLQPADETHVLSFSGALPAAGAAGKKDGSYSLRILIKVRKIGKFLCPLLARPLGSSESIIYLFFGGCFLPAGASWEFSRESRSRMKHAALQFASPRTGSSVHIFSFIFQDVYCIWWDQCKGDFKDNIKVIVLLFFFFPTRL